MKLQLSIAALTIFFAGAFASAQQIDQPRSDQRVSAPIYNVTVVERSIQAVNYQYRSGPTLIDLRGTVLLPESKGDVTVESKQGRTDIDTHVSHLPQSQRFGREYLTYVLWAISPEGRPHNLGELVPSGSDKASLHVTTDLQAFALIVTAEPYSAVRQPSDVVVLENKVREDTAGSTESVNAKYELLPRGQYTWRVSDSLEKELANAPKVSAKEADALMELYQAENAVGIAAAANAETYAADTFARAKQLLAQAQQYQLHKAETRLVIQDAREAAQTAEDARLIARQRQQEGELKSARADISRLQAEAAATQQSAQAARDAKAQAEAQLAQAQSQIASAQAQVVAAQQQVEQERAAREQAAAAAAAANARTEARRQQDSEAQNRLQKEAQATALRTSLLTQLGAGLPARDSSAGLVVTVPDSGFNGDVLRPSVVPQLEQVARILRSALAAHPNLAVRVDGYSDRSFSQSDRRAQAVRAALQNSALQTVQVPAAGLSDSHPLASHDTQQGREANSRVEIVISGDDLGALPAWDRPYTLTHGQ